MLAASRPAGPFPRCPKQGGCVWFASLVNPFVEVTIFEYFQLLSHFLPDILRPYRLPLNGWSLATSFFILKKEMLELCAIRPSSGFTRPRSHFLPLAPTQAIIVTCSVARTNPRRLNIRNHVSITLHPTTERKRLPQSRDRYWYEGIQLAPLSPTDRVLQGFARDQTLDRILRPHQTVSERRRRCRSTLVHDAGWSHIRCRRYAVPQRVL